MQIETQETKFDLKGWDTASYLRKGEFLHVYAINHNRTLADYETTSLIPDRYMPDMGLTPDHTKMNGDTVSVQFYNHTGGIHVKAAIPIIEWSNYLTLTTTELPKETKVKNNPEIFAYWLQGFFELTDATTLTPEQVKMIKDHLSLVFEKVTPELNTAELITTVSDKAGPPTDLDWEEVAKALREANERVAPSMCTCTGTACTCGKKNNLPFTITC